MEPSKYQQAIYNWIKDGSGNAIIQAVAGSGKTTTIIEASKLVPKDKKSIFVAFNKAIANELRDRLPQNIRAQTLHSFGLSLFNANTNAHPELDTDKLHNIVHSVVEDYGYPEGSSSFNENYHLLRRIIPILKAFNCDYKDFGQVSDIVAMKINDYELKEEMFEMCSQVMEKCKKQINIIDYDDMIWLPVINNFKSDKFDFVFVDETQDLNRVQFELIKKMCNGHTRVIAVGDRRQSIYAFRGADILSMDNFKEYFQATELPLSICYRCPKEVIKLAQEIVKEIEVSDTAKDGLVDHINVDSATQLAMDGDLILCRTNAPLIKMAFRLIRNHKKAIVRGRDIGKNVLNMVNKYKVINLEDLLIKVSNFRRLQEEKIKLIDEGKYDKRKRPNLITMIDTCDTIIAVAENVETIDELKSSIEQIFSDEKTGIICSSVHKAKGLEAERVFIINYDKMPHPMAKSDDEIEQEYNIMYVALTRSKDSLYFITDEM